MAWKTEIHIEHMVKRKMQITDFAAIGVAVLAGAVLFEAARLYVESGWAGGIALVFAFVGVYIAAMLVRKEFEYILTKNHLDVDCVYAKSRRKRKITIALEDVRTLELYNPKKAYHAKQTLDFSSRKKDALVYVLTGVMKEKPTCILFEPNAELLDALKERLGMLGIR